MYRKGRLYLVFEYVEKNLLEVLEENTVGIDVSLQQPKFNIFVAAKTVKILRLSDGQGRDVLPQTRRGAQRH